MMGWLFLIFTAWASLGDRGSNGNALVMTEAATWQRKNSVAAIATPMVAARDLLGSGSDAVATMVAARLKRRRQNSGDGQAGSDSDKGGAVFDW